MRKILYIAVALLALVSCANRGVGPQGGPKDSIPPLPLHAEPESGTLNFKGMRIEVTFNEYIQLTNVSSNLLMSPPQQNQPDVKARGKKLLVQFKDSLLDSTTYTIDFGDAVCDYRENVPLHGFSFYFSTGPEIDTLETYGRVYDALTLNPLSGILVGIHSNPSDTAFVKHPFLRIARTDSAGYFRIGNIHPGTYRLYALDDFSRDYRLTVGEALAFADEVLTVKGDTAQRDTAQSDSVVHRVEMRQLLLFKEEQQKLYLQRSLRDKQHVVTLLFSSSPDSIPQIRALADSVHFHMHCSTHRDTVLLWLTDSTTIRQDSLYFEARYRRTDSVNNLEWYTDTIRAIWRAPKLTAKAQEAQDRQNRNRRLEIKTNARKGFELNDTIRLNCSTPLASIEPDSIHLYERVDTVLKPVPFTLAPYDTLPMQLTVIATLKPESQYELHLDSATLHDIYGITHIAANYPLQVKALADYSTLRVKLNPFEPKARIQVLNKSDQVQRELPATEEGALFEYLKPETYYLRLYLDENGDGKWTTGSWGNKRQPEPIYYYPNSIQTKSNWDFEEEWNYLAIPQTEAKPQELIKAAKKK